MNADRSWTAAFRDRYAAWWAQAEPLIAEHNYSAAFKTYPWPSFTDTPWTPVQKPLADSRVAVVTTAGLYRPGVDRPFDTSALDGDVSYREIPWGTAIATLEISHPHFPHEVARADMNAIFPLDRLEELWADGVIGEPAPTHFSTMGYATRAADVAEQTAPALAARMREERVDVALLVPV